MNPFDILGAVLQSGTSPAGNRMGGVLGQMMGNVIGGGASGGASGGMPSGMPGGAPSGMPGGGMFDILTKVAGSMLGGGQRAAPGAGGAPGMGGMPGMGGGFPAEILKQIAGSMLGGGAPSGNAAAGAGSMAIFGTLAAQALEMAKSMMGGAEPAAGGMPNIRMDDQTAVIAGMRAPQTPQEQQQVMDMATLTLKAMMNAIKADGRVDEQEKSRLVGKLEEGGISAEEQRFVADEMQKPIDLDALVRAVPNAQAAAQIYAASLMAITLDTDGEKRYMAYLAAKLRLDPQVVSYLHGALGLA